MPATEVISHMLSDVWFDRAKVEEEEYKYQVYLQQQRVKPAKKTVTVVDPKGSVAQQIAEARQQIHQTLQDSDGSTQVSGTVSSEVLDELKQLRNDHTELKKLVDKLSKTVMTIESQFSKSTNDKGKDEVKPKEEEEEDDDDVDLFGSDSEDDEEQERIRAERLSAYAAKKSKKPALIAKSTIILDVKPWDDETDMKELEEKVRSVKTDGLLWGASKLVDVAYGIKKLQITCVVEDDKVGTDFLEEEICGFDDLVQSIDVAAFQKI